MSEKPSQCQTMPENGVILLWGEWERGLPRAAGSFQPQSPPVCHEQSNQGYHKWIVSEQRASLALWDRSMLRRKTLRCVDLLERNSGKPSHDVGPTIQTSHYGMTCRTGRTVVRAPKPPLTA
jgi:hypothetical protein